MPKKGILLLNIGSPISYKVDDVKTYLSTFLMDKDVINLPFLLRWILVKGIIVPRRAPISAGNYKKVWLENEGSPLTVYTDRFAKELQKNLSSDYVVEVGMRYSQPSIPEALKNFKKQNVSEILAVPMFPQYAEATTGSSLKEFKAQIKSLGFSFGFSELPPFYGADAFIENTARIIKESLQKPVDHYLFSYHGLPESHLKKVPGCLASENCCLEASACAKNCYKAQCVASTKKIAARLGLKSDEYTISYQSRLGRDEWIKPATDETLQNLARAGKKSLAVVCPSFVADCIETLEEIGIGGEELFHASGGENFQLIPCLNDDSKWIQDFAKLILKNF